MAPGTAQARATPADRPHVLAVNPWIHDFAAYDMWARPLGLLYLAGVLRDVGCTPHLIDCADRHHPSLGKERPQDGRFGCGKYPSQIIDKPTAINWMPRRFRRYGIEPGSFADQLATLPKPNRVH